MPDFAASLGASKAASTLLVLFIPSKDRDDRPIDQNHWVDEALRACVFLTDLTLGAVTREEPVVTERLGVPLLRQADDFGRLFFEPLQLSGSNRHMCAELKSCHTSSLWIATMTPPISGPIVW